MTQRLEVFHGFFLVLDRLYDTLDHKLVEWKESQAKYSGFMFRATHDPRGRIRRAVLLERLQIARSLANAVRYLHDHNVAFRDLVSLFHSYYPSFFCCVSWIIKFTHPIFPTHHFPTHHYHGVTRARIETGKYWIY